MFVAKKSGKKKCRIVICGNFINNDGNENTYSSTPDATGVIMVLRRGALLDNETLEREELEGFGVKPEDVEYWQD